MGTPLRETHKGYFDEPFEGPIFLWIVGIFTAYGFLTGVVDGFYKAGIGGAIAYGFAGLLAGALAGFVFGMIIGFVVKSRPILFVILIIVVIILIVRALWGVGKP